MALMSPASHSAKPHEVLEAAKRGFHAARSSYTERRARADHLGMAIALRAVLGPGDHAVDVGAHEGDVTRQILQSAPGGRLLAIEPLPHLAAALRAHAYAGVTVEECALTDDPPSTVEFLHVKNNPGYSGLRRRDYPDEPIFEHLTVQTRRLDDLVGEHGLEPRFIKIDVEGAEALVLRGATHTIERYRPVIVVEHGSAAEGYGESPGTFFDLAESLRLRIFNFDGDPAYGRDQFIEAVGPEGHFNFLMRP